MRIDSGKIVEATDSELFDYWLKHFDGIYMYELFKYACVRKGTRIIEEELVNDTGLRGRG